MSHPLHFFFAARFSSKTGIREASETTVSFCFWWTGQTSALQWAIQSPFATTNTRGVDTAMRLVCVLNQGMFAGGMGHMSLGIEMTR
jgi:hypothetical protein